MKIYKKVKINKKKINIYDKMKNRTFREKVQNFIRNQYCQKI